MKKNEGEIWVSSEDTHAYLNYCVCGEDLGGHGLSVFDAWITRCPKCNRGYRSEFVVWVYDPDEVDGEYDNRDVFMKRVEKLREECKDD